MRRCTRSAVKDENKGVSEEQIITKPNPAARRHKTVLSESRNCSDVLVTDGSRSPGVEGERTTSLEVVEHTEMADGLASTVQEVPILSSGELSTAVPPTLSLIAADTVLSEKPPSLDELVIQHIQEEEEELQKKSAKEEETASKRFMQEWEKEMEEEKEERYRKLQILLTKSETYTKYLLQRIEQQKQLMKESQSECEVPKKKRQRLSAKNANEDSSLVASQDSTVSSSASLGSGTPVLFTGSLRSYQLDGLVWLNTMYENGVNGILADEMGLGKTVQCIAAICHLVAMGVGGPYLIVVPLSTLPNWVNEFRRFAPKVPVMLYHGSKHEREELRRGVRKVHDVDGQWQSQPVVCTSYEVAMNDSMLIRDMRWKYLIVDEGHRIKNAQCQLIKALRMYDSTQRLLLTGTPLQNNLAELWSLLNFLLPEVFDDLDSFEYWFKIDCLQKEQQEQLIAEEKKRNVLAMLHQIMTPFILRRLKSDVELNLPPKREIIVYAPLTEQQRAFYQATVNKTIETLLYKDTEKGAPVVDTTPGSGRSRRSSTKKVDYTSMFEDKEDELVQDEDSLEDWVKDVVNLTMQRSNVGVPEPKKRTHALSCKMQNTMMQLRKVCSHPYLIAQPLDTETGFCKIDEDVVSHSGKMLLLDAILAELHKQGHKVLIFSQMTKMLDLIEDFCHLRQFPYCRLDGSTNLEDRRQQMELFNTDPDRFLFLLSTRAGGLGINLSAADTVIIYDSDWNPQCDLQAQDRAHRIGQTKPVMIYRLVCANTIDQRVVERATNKRRLEKMVIHRDKFKTGMTKESTENYKALTPQELLELLKSHDHEAEVDASSRRQVISKRELAALLDRSDLYQQWKGNSAPKVQGKKSVAARKSENMSKVFKVIEEEH